MTVKEKIRSKEKQMNKKADQKRITLPTNDTDQELTNDRKLVEQQEYPDE